jgi:hypothetical protein
VFRIRIGFNADPNLDPSFYLRADPDDFLVFKLLSFFLAYSSFADPGSGVYPYFFHPGSCFPYCGSNITKMRNGKSGCHTFFEAINFEKNLTFLLFLFKFFTDTGTGTGTKKFDIN